MATVTLKRVTLWRAEVSNQVGRLAGTLEPLARAGADLHVVMAYRYSGDETKAAIEVYPVSGRKVASAAQEAGLSAATIPTLLIQADNSPGLGYRIAQALADAGINMSFQVAQVIGRRASIVVGFENDADSRRAATLIKKAATAKRRRG